MKAKHNTLLTVSLVFLAAGCATAPEPVTYVQAKPVAEEPVAAKVVKVATPMPMPGQLKNLPKPKEQNSPEALDQPDPLSVIDQANQLASQNPEKYGYFNAIQQYDYSLGALYQVYTAPLKLTDIQLQPGEKIMGKPAAGDTVRWVMGVGTSRVEGQVRQHVYVKPTKPNLHTTLSINTDKRTYHIELHSYPETYMVAVNWRYPHEELQKMQDQLAHEQAEKEKVIAPQVNIDQLNSNYTVQVMQGSPRWVPTNVFDDGQKTFIQFPKEMLNREAPALFVLSSGNETQLVNYRVRNNYYIVDRLFERAELRLGQKDQDVVQLIRSQYRTASSYQNDGV